MQDRRRTARFSLNRPLQGTLHLMEDVLVERYIDSEITVVASMAAKASELVTVDRVVATNSALTDARVVESCPMIVDGVLRHRLTLRIADQSPTKPVMVGGLTRALEVFLIQIGEGGCLMRAGAPVPNGLYGELTIVFEDGSRSEALRVCRCQIVAGAGPLFNIAAQFPMMPSLLHSFRSRLLAETGERPAAARRLT